MRLLRLGKTARIALAVAGAATLAAVASGCGDTTAEHKADSGAIYLDLNHLKYQVQVSREINPHDPEDINYLIGLPPAERTLAPDQAWFGVWLAVYNRTKQTHLSAADFTVADTQGTTYRPIALQSINAFAYRQRNVERNDQIPRSGSVAYYAPTGGSLLLFKITLASFQNRPLELRIVDPTDPTVVATEPLDI